MKLKDIEGLMPKFKDKDNEYDRGRDFVVAYVGGGDSRVSLYLQGQTLNSHECF